MSVCDRVEIKVEIERGILWYSVHEYVRTCYPFVQTYDTQEESGWRRTILHGICVSSVSVTGPDTLVYPVYLTVTKLLLMSCVSSVSETGADTQCIWCI